MKEKIRNLFDKMKVRSRYKSMSDIINMIDSLVNQEVEKRIAERMPTIEDEERNVFKFSGNRSLSSSYFTGFFDACKWLRSRLSQKTEGGGE